MSVINQVLNQLEQRGAHDAPAQDMVRAVPQIRRKSAMPLLMLGLVLTIGFAAWQKMPMRNPDVAAVAAAPKAGNSPGAYEPEQPAAMPEIAPPSAVLADELQEVPQATQMFLPAARLSFELHSIPLPSSLREPKESVAPGRAEEHAAKPDRKADILRPAQPAAPVAENAPQPLGDVLPMKQVSPAQQADAEFHNAVALMQQGHVNEAIAGYEAALHLDAGHDAARQALVALLLESRRGADAGRVLQDGLKSKPEHTGFAMLLARLQVERGTIDEAMATLEKSLPHADSQADYQAFYAALLQRQGRHKEAITHYQIVLQLVPGNGVWLMGYGISLQAVQRDEDARNAYRRALESKMLNPELEAFVQQKLREL